MLCQLKKLELKVAHLNLNKRKSSAENERTLCCNKAEAEKAAAAAAAEAKYREQRTTSSCKAFANTTLQAMPAAQTPAATPAAAQTRQQLNLLNQTQAAAPAATVLVQLMVHLHHLTAGECITRRHWPMGWRHWGNGGQYASAAAAGFVQDLNHVGAIACWNDGGYGHVKSSRYSCSIYNKYPSLHPTNGIRSTTTVVGLTQQQLKVSLLISLSKSEN